MPRTLNFITSNANKLAEVQAILANVPGLTLTSKNIDVPELQGGIEEVSREKCKVAAEKVQGPVLTEDTCLVFDAWGELPGPYIKYFVTQFGPAGLHKLLAGFEDKSAQTICTFAYCEGPSKEPLIFQGRTKGKIVEARGPTHFGYDAAFEYEGKTFAEMEKAEKNQISHRGKALAKLKEWLAESGGEQ